MKRKSERWEYSTPACFMHEFVSPGEGEPEPEQWDEVKAWRTARRQELVARRVAKDTTERRRLARRHIEAGGVVALPGVVGNAAPVEFWRWRPGVAMRRGP